MKKTLLTLLSFVVSSIAYSQTYRDVNVDYTDYISNADCSNSNGWSLTSGGDGNSLLQLDTWSSRGGKDGSGMVTPFMEYFTQSYNGTLPDASIRHSAVKGLPAGRYVISAKVRLYDERSVAQPSGVTLYANGYTRDLVYDADKSNGGVYNGQRYTNFANPDDQEQQLEFYLNEGESLDFGFDVTDANYNWLSFRDVKLRMTGAYVPEFTGYRGVIFRHKKTGKYLAQGAKWGTQMIVSERPDLYRFSAQDDGSVLLSSFFIYGSYVCPVGDDLYVDQGQYRWNFGRVDADSNTAYTISSSADDSYLTVDDSGICRLSDEPDEWEMMDVQQHKAALYEASEDNPVDATFLIHDPDFKYGSQITYWNGSPTLGGQNQVESGQCNRCAEKWNTTFDIYQTLVDIPNGKYVLSVQGFYRDGGLGTSYNHHANGTEALNAYLYANKEKTPLMSIYGDNNAIRFRWTSTDVNMGSQYIPNQMDGAAWRFFNELYKDNQVEVIVRDNQLTIGIKKSEAVSEDWTIFDNFRLTYLGHIEGDNSSDGGQSIEDLYEASEENPVDATFLVKNADFSSRAGWSGTSFSSNSFDDATCAYVNYGNFNVYQFIDGLPNGKYKVQMKGFYRYGRYDTYGQYSYGGADHNVFAMYTQDFATINRRNGTEKLYAQLFANEQNVSLCSPFDYAHEDYTHNGDFHTDLGWVPNSSRGAIEAFEEGEYDNELYVYVMDGHLELGVRKNAGYKDDWTVWGDLRLTYCGESDMVYPTDIAFDEETINMSVGQTITLHPHVLPENASSKRLYGYSSGGLTVYDDKIYAYEAGEFDVYYYVNGNSASNSLHVVVSGSNGNPSDLKINEIQVANIDMFVDPSYNYGGWVEVYNPSAKGINLGGLYVTDDTTDPYKFRLSDAIVPAGGYCNIWFDHNSADYRQVNFKLNPDGGTIYLYRNGTMLTSQAYPAAVTRTSYARKQDGTGDWAITSLPTPEASNKNSKEFLPVESSRLAMPLALPEVQLLTSPTVVRVSIPAGAELCYTTDGTAPSLTNGNKSEDGEFLIEKNTILRLRFFQDGKLPSAVSTYSYLFKDKDYTLPILSVVSDPDNFYNDTIGVFVPGVNGVEGGNVGNGIRTNWQRDWERPVNMEYIGTDGQRLISMEADMERCGGWSRAWYPFSFKLKATKQYEGINSIDYAFFPDDKPYNKHKALQIRNGGNDLLCRVKDASLNQVILTSGFNVDAISYEPAHVFVNGVYQGMMNIREPNNKHFSYSNYGIDPDYVDQFEFGYGDVVKAGTKDRFRVLRDLTSQPASEENYKKICEMLDMDEFINYYAVQLYLGGDDWPTNNMKGFMDQEDGKFHLVLFDLDQCLRFDEQQLSRMTSNTSNSSTQIWTNLLNRYPQFRRQFVDAYSIVAGSVFDIDRAREIIRGVAERLEQPLSLENLEPWTTTNETLGILTEARKKKMMSALSKYSAYGVYGKSMLMTKLSSDVPDARILINGQDVPTGEFNGYLYQPITLTAKAPMGYEFTGWKVDGKIVSTDSEYNLTTDASLVASYKKVDVNPISVNEVSASNSVNANTDYWKKDDWVELYNVTDKAVDVAGMYLSDDESDPQKFQIPANDEQQTLIPAHGHLVVWASKRSNVGMDLHANFKLSNTDGQKVILTSEDGRWNSTLTYEAHGGQESVGRYPDGGADVYHFYAPSLVNRNRVSTADKLLYMDEMIVPPALDKFTLDLAEGWNWISHPLKRDIMLTEIRTNADRILGQSNELALDAKLGWTGNLSEMSPTNMYKVHMNEQSSYDFEAPFFIISDNISLHKGWNWVGYPLTEKQTLTEALSNFNPSEGDVMLGQDGLSTFESGQWKGTLNVLNPGIGYMYRSASLKSLTYNDPAKSTEKSKAPFHVQPRSPWTASASAHPSVMGIIARVVTDGTFAQDDVYSIGAFSEDGECRGVGRYLDGLLYINVYGEGGENIIFRAADVNNGVVREVKEMMTLTSDVQGSRKQPILLHVGDATSISSLHSESAFASVEYYTLDGILVGTQKSELGKGVYVSKVLLKDGSVMSKKIVIK